MSRVRIAAIGAAGVAAIAVVLTPWYALDDYVPNGWDATWWARGALVAMVAAIVLLRLAREMEAAAAAAIGLACIVFRVIAVPDFGLGFDGLDVTTARRWGLWLALAASLLAVAAAARLAITVRRHG